MAFLPTIGTCFCPTPEVRGTAPCHTGSSFRTQFSMPAQWQHDVDTTDPDHIVSSLSANNPPLRLCPCMPRRMSSQACDQGSKASAARTTHLFLACCGASACGGMQLL